MPSEFALKDALRIRGQYIQLSKAKSIIEQDNNPRVIQIFALHTVFIDASLELPGVTLSIIAPNWVINGSQKINLTSSDSIDNPTKAPSGFQGEAGKDGAPGKAGKPGGSFLGIGSTFTGGENLQILANGGKGGKGQDGGDGGNAKNGEISKDKPSGYQKDPYTYPIGTKGVHWEYRNREPYNNGWPNGMKYKYNFKVFGTRADDGFKGGNGGAGGLGGLSGNIIVRAVGETSQVTSSSAQSQAFDQVADRGPTGDTGVGGKGGKGGQDGDTIIWKYVNTEGTSFIHQSYTGWEGGYVSSEGVVRDKGPSGINGKNDAGRKESDDPVKKTVLAQHINGFKVYLRENVNNPILKSILTNFLSQIEREPTIDELYDVEAYLDDLIGLETQFFALYKAVDLTPSYQSLLNRIENFANKFVKETDEKNIKEQSFQKKALAYAYTAALSKQTSTNGYYLGGLIVHLKEFITNVSLVHLEELRTTKKELMNTKEKTEYKNEIMSKINEANDFIQEEVIKDIHEANAAINDDIKELVKQNVEKIEDAEKNKKKLIQKQNDLKRKMVLGAIFGVMEGIGKIASFFGPYGVAAEAVTSGVSSVTKSFVLDGKSAKEGIPKAIPEGVKSGIRAVTEFLEGRRQQNIEGLKSQIYEIEKLCGNKSKEQGLESLSRDISTIKEMLYREENKISKSDYGLTVDQLKKRLLDAYEAKKHGLEKDIQTVKDKKESEKIFKQIGNVVKVGTMSHELYLQISKNQGEIAAVGAAIESADKDIKKLREFEDSIYTKLVPAFRDVQNNVERMENTLGKKSQVGLDVAKWRLQQMLKQFIDAIKEMTKGFAVEKSFEQAINRMVDGLMLLIQIYDRIQSFNEQEKLGSYIANLTSDGSSAIDLKGSGYQGNVLKLENVIQSNLVLWEYERVLAAFKQYIFPFADIELSKFYLPTSLSIVVSSDNLDQLVKQAKSRVKAIRDALNNQSTTIGTYDKFLETSTFDFERPFYTWVGSTLRPGTIENFLSGQPITLQADIELGRQLEEAVKFNKIGLFLTTTNDAEKTEKLREVLERFKIEMTHFGYSYYKFHGRVYVIRGDEQLLSHGFKDPDDPKTSNDTYTKIVRGDLLLSPYTTWKLQIVKWKGEFNELDKFAPIATGIDIHLVGNGKYITEAGKGSAIPDLNLEKYYETVKEYNQE